MNSRNLKSDLQPDHRQGANIVASLRNFAPLIGRKDRWLIASLVFLQIFVSIAELAGVASLLPFIAVIADSTGAGGSEPVFFKSLFSLSSSFAPVERTVVVGIVVISIISISNALLAFGTWAVQKGAFSIGTDMSAKVLRGYLNFPYEDILERNASHVTITASDEVWRFVSFVLIPSINLVGRSVLVLLAIVATLVSFLVAGILVIIPISLAYFLFYVWAKKYLSRLGAISDENLKLRHRIAHEAVVGIREIKLLDQSDLIGEAYRSVSEKYAGAHVSASFVSSTPRYLIETVAFSGLIVLLLVLSSRGNDFQSVISSVVICVVAGYRMVPACQQIFSSITQVRFGLAQTEHLQRDARALAFLSGPGGSTDVDSRERRLPLRTGVRLSNVTFTYRSKKSPAINGLSLFIPARSIVALVGPSGAGKTTLLGLLLALLLPESGEIRADDVLLDSGSRRAWQNGIGYVPQDPFLIDDTILANIALGVPKEKIDIGAVERAAKMANAHQFISRDLSHGYQTKVGDRGTGLSGGQKQRIAIARALYRDPSILLLDEVTSALDAESEALVLESIKRLKGERTVILVTHRPAALDICDLVFSLNAGRASLVSSSEEVYDDER
jgi:ABC-type multidrug transport system fused ATPase/permease subunit